MATKPPAESVPPIEPVPDGPQAGPVAAPAPPAPPVASPAPFVDPYAQTATPPPPYAPAGYAPAGYAPGAYPPAYQTGYYSAPQPPHGLAIASLVTGIAGAFFSLFYGIGFLPALAGVITGHLARKRQPTAGGMALAGLICGYVGLAISLLWIIGIILFIVFIAANPTFNS